MRERGLLSLALALLLSACGSAAAPQAQSTKIVVGLSQTIAQFLPAWVAKDAGVYARHGLDVDQRTAVATTIMASLLASELTLAVTGGPEILNATANGADLVMVGNLAPVAALKLIVADSVKSKDDLVGKKMGITRLGSTTHSNSRALFSRIGLNPDKDVSYVQLDNAANEAAALISGQISGALLAPPENTKLDGQGFHVLYDLSELKFPATGQVIVIPRAWLNSRRDAAQQFVDSLVESMTLIRRDRSTALASLKTGMKLDDPALANGVYDYFVTSVLAPLPYAQPEQFANDVSVIAEASGKLQDFDVSRIIDNSLVKSAEERGLAKG
ncbi:MAG TPA: ABC transporter substrate-binding protein [Chloroflexota bacterium]|nr:ABC transporter substrate-binding protein [Chloroflexota bacterium]